MLLVGETQLDALRQSAAHDVCVEKIAILRRVFPSATFELATKPIGIIATLDDGRQIRFGLENGKWTYLSPAGRWRAHSHDLFGHLAAVEDSGGGLALVERRDSTRHVRVGEDHYRFECDPHGRLKALRFPDSSMVAFYYERGRLAGVDLNGERAFRRGLVPEGRWFEDAAGNRSTVTITNRRTERNIQLSRPDGSKVVYRTVSESRPLGVSLDDVQLVAASYADGGRTTLSYPDASWKTITITDSMQVADGATPHHQTRRSYRDTLLISETIDEETTHFGYSTTGDLVSIEGGDSRQFERDADGALTAISAWRKGLQLDCDGGGALKTIRFDSGTVVDLERPKAGRSQTTIRNKKGTVLYQERCCYGSRLRLLDRRVATPVSKRHCKYQYDSRGRLVVAEEGLERQGAIQSTHQTSFELDVSGNRKTYDGLPARYDSLNRLQAIGDQSVRHDAFDNLIERWARDVGWRYAYAQGNRLAEAHRDGVLVARYTYDALGRRISKQVGATKTRYHWADDLLMGEESSHPDGRTQRIDYLWLAEYPVLLGLRIDGVIYDVGCDHRLAPIVVTDAAGEVVWRASYDSFGGCTVELEAIPQPIRLYGQYCDAETGLHYHLSRYYDPTLGRFLSPDARREGAGQLNHYTYCDGDPLSRVDMMGEFLFIPALVVVGKALLGGFAATTAIEAGAELIAQTTDDTPGVNWGDVGGAAAEVVSDPKQAAITAGSSMLGVGALRALGSAGAALMKKAPTLGGVVGGAASSSAGETVADQTARELAGEQIPPLQRGAELTTAVIAGTVLPRVGDDIVRRVLQRGDDETGAAIAKACASSADAAPISATPGSASSSPAGDASSAKSPAADSAAAGAAREVSGVKIRNLDRSDYTHLYRNPDDLKGVYEATHKGNTFTIMDELRHGYAGTSSRLRVLEESGEDFSGVLAYTPKFDESGKLVEAKLNNVYGIKGRSGAGHALGSTFMDKFKDAPRITSTLVDTNQATLNRVLRKSTAPSIGELQEAVPAFRHPGYDYELKFDDYMETVDLVRHKQAVPGPSQLANPEVFESSGYQAYRKSGRLDDL